MVAFGQKWLYSSKSGCISTKLLFSGKVFIFGQKRLYLGNWLYSMRVVVFEQKWLYLGKNRCTRAKVVVFG